MIAQRKRRLQLERLEDRTMFSGLPQQVVVMSENLYMGADPFPILVASVVGKNIPGGKEATSLLVTDFWNKVKATDFNKRADAIVQQIADNKPDLIGLQEVMTYYTGVADSFAGNPTKASTVQLDFLQILQSKLAAKGLHYKAFSQKLGDFEAPGTINGKLQDLRLVDSVAILARNDLPATQVSYSMAQGGTFQESLPPSDSLIGPITIHRGWNAIDVKWGQSDFRFINMCLETPVAPWTQAIQGWELLVGPAYTAKPVILAGDSNSDGSKPGKPFSVLDNTFTYSMLTFLGFQDAWSQTHPTEPGYTWGNQPDLKNVQPMSYQLLGLGPYRMDLVLHRGGFQAQSMKRLGVDAQTRAVLGMWPSDHAGVVATLAIQQQVNPASPLGSWQYQAAANYAMSLLNHQMAAASVPQAAMSLGCNTVIPLTDVRIAAGTTLNVHPALLDQQWVYADCTLPPLTTTARTTQPSESSTSSLTGPHDGVADGSGTVSVSSRYVDDALMQLERELVDGLVDELVRATQPAIITPVR